MDRYFIDTNIILRFLTDDVPAQAEVVAHLLRQAVEGKVVLQTNVLVIAEIVWTLESYYKQPRGEIRTKVLAILNTPGLSVENADLILSAIVLYADKNVDFIDAYNACWMKRHDLSRVYTFDTKHFSRLEGILPLVPGQSRET